MKRGLAILAFVALLLASITAAVSLGGRPGDLETMAQPEASAATNPDPSAPSACSSCTLRHQHMMRSRSTQD